MTERSNTRSDTDVAVHRKSDCERLPMLPLVIAMYEVVFSGTYAIGSYRSADTPRAIKVNKAQVEILSLVDEHPERALGLQ